MEAADQRRDVEDSTSHGYDVLNVSSPVRVVEHQLDIGPLGDDVVEPALVL